MMMIIDIEYWSSYL